MIPVNEGAAAVVDAGKQEVVERDIDPDEQAKVYAIDSELESAAMRVRLGDMFEVTFSKDEYSALVIQRVKHIWETGGWVVGVREDVYRDTATQVDTEKWRLVFVRPPAQHDSLLMRTAASFGDRRRQAREVDFSAPESVSVGAPRTSGGLLVRMPTRARPIQALDCLAKWREMASEHVQIEVVMDEDDETMNNSQVLQRLSDLDCIVTIGKHRNKIEACNAGRVDDWNVLVLASDDMWPVKNYDQKIAAAFERHFPLFDGAICTDDGYNKPNVKPGEPITCTLPIMGRHLYESYGRQVYYPGYKSIFCDSDQTWLFTKMNRMVFVDEVIAEHWHPAAGKARFDLLYQENAQHDSADAQLFEERKARGFDAPEITLSLLICTTRVRRRRLEWLVDYLRWQARGFQDSQQRGSAVEICVDSDEHITVGAKRQRLLERACGEYVCFVDDDDWVAYDFVSRLVQACWKQCDCASLVGVYTVNGENPRRFEHSLKYDRWEERADGLLVRTPNHLSLVRRELALKAGFVSQNVGEDHLYSDALKPFLKSEADTGEVPLYYYWSRPQDSVQR